MKKHRLDELVFTRGLANSRERAKTTVMSGHVYVDGKQVTKPGAQVSSACAIEVRGAAIPYVSRGGLKLEKALDEFGVDPSGMLCIDCGASTGGFTDCLLQRGARGVYAVDVGYGQLAWSLREDNRVVSMERTNIRYLEPSAFPEKFDIAVMDLSFISLKLVLPVVRRLLRNEGQAICLVKPQFEAGREKVGKKGVVRDKSVHTEVLEKFVLDARNAGYGVTSLTYSPIRGPEGNVEYLAQLRLLDVGGTVYASDSQSPDAVDSQTIDAVVDAAHDSFRSQRGVKDE